MGAPDDDVKPARASGVSRSGAVRQGLSRGEHCSAAGCDGNEPLASDLSAVFLYAPCRESAHFPPLAGCFPCQTPVKAGPGRGRQPRGRGGFRDCSYARMSRARLG